MTRWKLISTSSFSYSRFSIAENGTPHRPYVRSRGSYSPLDSASGPPHTSHSVLPIEEHVAHIVVLCMLLVGGESYDVFRALNLYWNLIVLFDAYVLVSCWERER